MQHLIVVTSTLITIEPLEHMSHLETACGRQDRRRLYKDKAYSYS